MAVRRAQQRPLPQLCPDLKYLSWTFNATEYSGGVAGCHLNSHRAGFAVCDAAQRVGSGKSGQVSGGGCPARQHGRLGQQQHHRHHHHDHQCKTCSQDRAGAPFTGVRRARLHPVRPALPPPPKVPRGNSVRGSAGHLFPLPSVRPLAWLAAADSLRVEARAVRVHGNEEPRGPATRSLTVMLNHPSSAATEAEAVPPARVLTVLWTLAGSSPLASARAPARAPSSIRSCVTPAAAPARSMASRVTTAGKVTANSAVTAPRDSFQASLPPNNPVLRNPVHPRRLAGFEPRSGAPLLVTAAPARHGSGSAGSRGPRHCGG